MFYEVKIKDHIRVDPKNLGDDVKESVLKSLNQTFEGYVTDELGFVIAVSDVENIGEGHMIPGDGAAFYETTFSLFVFRPEINEVVVGKVTEITDFGAFMEIGPVDGMIHIGQTMDDYVSFSKENVLTGKETKKTLKSGDFCRARIVAISFKDPTNPKIGLTMRQPWLGNVKWIEEELKKENKKK